MVLKTLLLAVLIGSISTVHILFKGSELGIHVLHQQLFYIPLILTSFWFGLRIGAITAVGICLLYGIPMLFDHPGHHSHLIVFTQICLYCSVALLIGWLSDRQRKQQQKLFQNERAAALGKAASTLSFEVQNIVGQIEKIHRDEGGSEDDNMSSEIDRLRRLLTSLNKVSIPLGDITLSHDLNDLVLQRLPIYRKNATEKRIRIEVDLDPGGCPTMISSEAIPRVIDSLVDNAIDFSESGQSIILRSKRGGDFCSFEVADSGPGVAEENVQKLFSAFFTTKPDGYGLSLSSGRKILHDLGGDLIYERNENGGATFRMKIPREGTDENIDGYVRSVQLSPELSEPGQVGGADEAT